MVVLSFSVFKDELLAGKKTRTMRRATSKKWQSVYENIAKKRIVLQVYWKQRTKEQAFLFYAIPIKIEKRRLGELSDEEWKKDGFKDRFEGLGWFSLTYNLMNDKENPALNNFEVFIIQFKRVTCNFSEKENHCADCDRKCAFCKHFVPTFLADNETYDGYCEKHKSNCLGCDQFSER